MTTSTGPKGSPRGRPRAPKPPGSLASTSRPVVSTIDDPLAAALGRLARGTSADFASLLHHIERHVVVAGTNITVHCHCLTVDGNGRPRIAALVEAVAEHVLDYAIPRSEYRAARDEALRTGSSQKIARLHTKARKLFTDLTQSGEGGELLLFALAEKLLELPQLVCKMSLKTNTRMHIHGADGLHAGVDPKSGHLLLYWGESKIFGDVVAAVRECLASLAPMLHDHEASRRDLQILQRHLDVDDEALENALLKFLDPDDPAFNALEFCGLCLVGFDSDAYPSGTSRSELKAIEEAIVATLPKWKDHLLKRVSEEKLEAFSMHFLFVPFPSADKFRELFREQLGLHDQNMLAEETPNRSGVRSNTVPSSTSPAPKKSKAGKKVTGR